MTRIAAEEQIDWKAQFKDLEALWKETEIAKKSAEKLVAYWTKLSDENSSALYDLRAQIVKLADGWSKWCPDGKRYAEDLRALIETKESRKPRMTAAELIEELKKHPGDAQICIMSVEGEFEQIHDVEYVTPRSKYADVKKDTVFVTVS